ncbi:NUDIX hydrolase [Basilea psittacipulmonis]|uniref:Nudix hydrolase domain-containing protein n=1 Tax=Basilea psittacipulmonis DSM 24701 TaxID=1072685 RepID=A0A077DFM6_9BURK|nr:NUDIX hydrolase [Basilea psittacipulmonis]AIL32981.1 hypothetical protein IX83_06335 [Basilea psittacipulmonis DSM 24701]
MLLYHPATQRKFCTECGHPLESFIPPLENRVRDVCQHCGAIHYSNPLTVVGTIPIWENKILLCKRAIEPRQGFWTLPAGFMENDESTQEGAIRETIEEAGANILSTQLFNVISCVSSNQIHFFYLAPLRDNHLNPGVETLEAQFFSIDNIPWNQLSFNTVITALKHYVNDNHHNVYHDII